MVAETSGICEVHGVEMKTGKPRHLGWQLMLFVMLGVLGVTTPAQATSIEVNITVDNSYALSTAT